MVEDKHVADSRERRRVARMLIAERKVEDAAKARVLAEAVGDPGVANALLSGAKSDKRTAHKQRKSR